MAILAMAFQLVTIKVASASDVSAGDVVINEVAWSGTADNWRDEWIELHNTKNTSVDLSGWKIEDDKGKVYLIETGEIPAKGYFLIADKADSISNVTIDAVITLSLVDGGNQLVLKNSAGTTIDSLNSSVATWPAGSVSPRASMERIDPSVSGELAENWATAVSGNGAKGKDGSDILGTPRGINSVYNGEGPEVSMGPEVPTVYMEKFVKFSVSVDEVEDLYAYGFEIYYNPEVLNFVEANESDFLKADGASTAFYSALLNGQEGKLIVGNARLLNPAVGIDGGGELFEMHFEVISTSAGVAEVQFGAGSFLADSSGDVSAKLGGLIFGIGEEAGDEYSGSVSNLQSSEGEDRYSIKLTWENPDADYYIVEKKMHDGNFVKVAETELLYFIDYQSIVPNLTYTYRITPVKESSFGTTSEIQAIDTRGLKGDNNRSDSVDGRDIENLARAFGSQYGNTEYNPLADTNFDGIIDGSELIDIGFNFGVQY